MSKLIKVFNNVIRPVEFQKIQTTCQYRMAKKNDRGEIVLYGPIGASFWSDGITASKFKQDLKDMGSVKTIDLRINSEGGDVFDGQTMYALLAEHKADVIVHVDGLAASIASLIAMAGKEIHMAAGAFMMIHNPWGGTVGDSADMRRMADLLDRVKDQVANAYVARTNNKKEKISQWMDEETWMTAEDAKDMGFADFISEPVRAAASVFKPELFKNLPSELRPNRALAMKMLSRVATLVKKP